MPVLLLRLAGPMQSWGIRSRFTIRDTALEPSKSGVIGLLCAALGKPADDSPGPWPALSQLASLRMGVRVDRQGLLSSDYHTAGGGDWQRQPFGVYKADGTRPGPVLSTRYYLADADFLVGLEGPLPILTRLDSALAEPVWQLSLGRKSFLPSVPVRLPDRPPDGPGLTDLPLERALLARPLGHPFADPPEPPETGIRLVIEPLPGSGGMETRNDVPISFLERRFASRRVDISYCLPDEVPSR